MPKAPKKFFDLNELALETSEKIFDRPKARKKSYKRQGADWGGGGGGAPLVRSHVVC